MPIDALGPRPGAAHRSSVAPPRPRKGLLIAGVAAAAVAVVVVVAGLASRAHDTSQVKTWTANQATPSVSVVTPAAPSGPGALVLPGNLQAFYNAPIYSRVSGYVRDWKVDIGAEVKTGQLLAVIDTPELDQQLIQARADLASAEANKELAAVTAQRWNRLLSQDAVSKQETDEKTGDLAAKTAQVNAAKANVDRLSAMKAFSRIVAPFDGVVTARRTDIGALVNAGAGATANSELFDVAKIGKLRLYVRAPQTDSARLKPGVTATMTVPEYPGRTFPATLVTTSKSVSDASGTVLVELMVDNPGEVLQTGDYAQVKFNLLGGEAHGPRPLRLPSSALLFRQSGMEAAVVGPDNRVHLRHVTIGRDLGSVMEIAAGLQANDRVINNPSDSIAEGQLVHVIPAGGETPAGGAPHAAG
jgi:RND family efflux transporter MFP subunit